MRYCRFVQPLRYFCLISIGSGRLKEETPVRSRNSQTIESCRGTEHSLRESRVTGHDGRAQMRQKPRIHWMEFTKKADKRHSYGEYASASVFEAHRYRGWCIARSSVGWCFPCGREALYTKLASHASSWKPGNPSTNCKSSVTAPIEWPQTCL